MTANNRSSMVKLILGAVVALSAQLLNAQPETTKYVPVPKLDQVHLLRVLVLNNERFPLLDVDTVEKILGSTKLLAYNQLGLQVIFEKPKYENFNRVKALLDARGIEFVRSNSLDLAKEDDAAKLRELMLPQIQQELGHIDGVRRFAKNYLLSQPVNNSDMAFARALADTQTQIFRDWKKSLLPDGTPLLGNDYFNEFVFWSSLGHSSLPFEVVITNQLIASAEIINNSVHSALRGGVSNGITNSSYASRNGVFSILSVYPFFSQDAMTLRLRGNKKYSAEESAKYAAAMLVHELGHQLLHLGHPFDNSACVMRPPVLLQFDIWYMQLNADKCKLNSNKSMIPGKTVKHKDIR